MSAAIALSTDQALAPAACLAPNATSSAPAVSTVAPALSRLEIPPAMLAPLARSELDRLFKGGEPESDDCERLLAWAARARGGIDLAIADGLLLLRRGDRLACLGYHLDDYAREVLDIGETTTRNLVRLAAGLRDRPLLREALRSGRVGLRAAETVLSVAVGDAEAKWVQRAEVQTVRELEQRVRLERSGGADEEDEEWVTLRTHLPDFERGVLDLGLDVARRVDAGATRLQQLEAIAQELLAGYSSDDPDDDTRALGGALRPMRGGAAPGQRERERRAALESETERWSLLQSLPPIPAPALDLDELATAREVDVRLRQLGALRSSCDEIIGWCAHAIRRSGMVMRLGFATFRHYIEERLGLPPRAVEQREALERRLWASPALREARRQKVGYEKLRALSRLPERDIASWTARAHGLTCIALRRRVDGERSRQMRVARTLVISMPRRLAVLLAAAVHTVRQRAGHALPIWKCLSSMAWHFVDTWIGSANPPRTRSQKVRERDDGLCQVPGCSRAAAHSHHVKYRSRGGGDDPSNQVGLCGFHHLRCIHGGHLRVEGRAPDALTWFVGGQPWDGRPSAAWAEPAVP